VAATALIIPKDAEDRILYTILCKPVPRIDYLMGKVLGVLALTLIAVLLMDAVMTLVLWLRTDTVVAEQIASLKGRYTVEENAAVPGQNPASRALPGTCRRAWAS